MKRTKLIIILSLLLVLLIPAGIALADEVVEEGDVINNDITLFGENLHIKEGAVVNGDVVVFDGRVEIDGEINGDIVIFGGGDIEFSSTATVKGECVLFGGSKISGAGTVTCQTIPVDEIAKSISAAIPGLELNFDNLQAPQFTVDMSEIAAEMGNSVDDSAVEVNPPAVHFQEHEFEGPEVESSQFDPPPFEAPIPSHDGRWEERYDHTPSFFGRIFGALGRSVVFGLLAMLFASLFPENLERMEAAVRSKPLAMGVVGFLTSIAVPSLIAIVGLLTAVLIFVCIGILGIPLILALAFGLIGGMLMGWATMGKIVGQWLAGRINLKNKSLAFQTGLGTAALTFALGLLGVVPFIPEQLVSWIIIMVGLGAAALTQFGRKAYPRSAEPPVDSGKIDIVLQTLPEDLK